MTDAAAGGRQHGSPRVAVVGAGAVGCWYGGMLARSGVPVTLIGRAAHVEAMNRDGLRLESATFDERVPVQASTDVAAIAGARVVLVCVKSTDTAATGASLVPHLADPAHGVCVLSLQNGVDNAARLQAILGRPVAPAVVYVASEMGGPGHVRHMGRGELVIPQDIGADGGSFASTDLVALFARGGVPVELSDNVMGALWGKLVLNCGYNAMSAITDVFAAVDRIAQTMPQQVSSTCQDLRRGKPSEIDHLNGFVANEGERLGVATPVNRALHALVKAIEARGTRP